MEELTAAERKQCDDVTCEKGVWPCYENYRTSQVIAPISPYPLQSIYVLLRSKKLIPPMSTDESLVIKSQVAEANIEGVKVPRGHSTRSYFMEQYWRDKIREVFDRMVINDITLKKLMDAPSYEL